MFVFVDETGELEDYSPTGSKFFGLCALVVADLGELQKLHKLRVDLSREGRPVSANGFHAKESNKRLCYRICETIGTMDVIAYPILVKKERIYPVLREQPSRSFELLTETLFYYLFSHTVRLDQDCDVIFSTFGTGADKRKVMEAQIAGLERARQRSKHAHKAHAHFWQSSCDYGLQAVDFFAWSVQRSHEINDERAEKCKDLLQKRLNRPFLMFEQTARK